MYAPYFCLIHCNIAAVRLEFAASDGSFNRDQKGTRLKSLAAPATVSREYEFDIPLGNREGEPHTLTCEPGDLPLRASPTIQRGASLGGFRTGDNN